jgi:hypothetical protein
MPRSPAAPTYEDEAAMIDASLVYMAAAPGFLPATAMVHAAGYQRSAAAIFARIQQLGLHADDLSREDLLPREDTHLAFAPARPDQLLEVCTVSRLGWRESQRLRTLGFIQGHAPLSRATQRSILNDGTWDTRDTLFFSNGRGWHPLLPVHYGRERTRIRYTRTHWREFAESTATVPPTPTLACVAAWSRVKEWSIEFRLPGAPGLCVTTDSVGARELLRMRDVPEGRTRREALRHWVREHWRRQRRDADVERQVRQHLRGADTCVWFGLESRIVPSQEDLDLASYLKANKVPASRPVALAGGREPG